MRTRVVLTLGVLLAAMTAGCSEPAADDVGVASARSAGATPSSSASARSGPDPDAMMRYSKCMRANGLDWFPDPRADGGLVVQNPPDVPDSKIKAAEQACKRYLPDAGPGDQKPSAEDIEKARRMARCMRENGVPNFPDPDANGETSIDADKLGTGPGDPTFDKAEQACKQYLPPNSRHEQSTPQEASGA